MFKNRVWTISSAFFALVLFLVMVAGFSTQTTAQEKGPIVVGLLYDATGPTQLVGIPISTGERDYFNLINRTGGIAGHPLKVIEYDHSYKVPPAVEAFELFKSQGAVYFPAYGTPIVYALGERVTKAKIPVTSPGFGRADAADGKRFPYIFPIAASYWSQAGASVKYVLDQWKAAGNSGMPKIAYLYYDNPAGREPFPIFKRLQKKLGFTFKSWGIPPPGVEMGAMVLDIVHRYKPDWIITHIFGKGPAISIKELQRNGFPLDHVISFVWGSAYPDVNAAGWDTAQGYLGLQFAGAKTDYPVLNAIKKMYRDDGKEPPKAMAESPIYYNRGVLWAAVPVQAIKLAYEKYGYPLTGENVKNGFEMIRKFSMGGMVPPLTITQEDHEGGGFVQVTQVKGKKWVVKKDWFHGFRDEVKAQLAEAAKSNK